jgi:hypothetical protein
MKAKERALQTAQGQPVPETTGHTLTDKDFEQFRRRLKGASKNEAARKQQDLEVMQLMAELNERTKSMPLEELDPEEVQKECVAYYKAIPMYDWGAKIISNEHDMSQKYGSRIIDQIRTYQRDAQPIPRSLIADMHRIHEGRPPLKSNKNKATTRYSRESHKPRMSQAKWNEIEKGTSLKPKQYSNEHFSTVKAGLFNVARSNKGLRNPTTLLLYLLQHRAWEGKRDKHDTYDTWYLKRRLIVASVGEEKICADPGVHEKTVRNWTKTLEKSGVIRKLKDGQENVYILGEVINNKELFYYSGAISWKANSGSIH